MKNIFYITAFLLIIIWAIGFIGFKGGSLFHLLLIIAFALAVKGILFERRT